MRPVRALLCSVGAALMLGPASCAALVGADFDSEHLAPPAVTPDATVPADSALAAVDTGAGDTGIGSVDATPPVIAADGGSCPTGLVDCSDVCVNPANDPAHCGKCTTACPSDPHGPAVCVASVCAYACEPGWTRCAGGCCPLSFPDASGNDAAPGVDSGPADPGVACASAYCSVVAQSYCCGGTDSGDLCVGSTNQTYCPWLFYCDDQGQCGPGMVCCYDDTPQVTLASCQSSCSGPNQVQFCRSSAECAGGTQCTGVFSGAGLQTSYSYCQ